MAEYINQNEVAFALAEETKFGEAPTTGDRLDLPTETGQAPLTYTQNMIEDNTQRPNRETSAPTRGHASVSGSMSMRLRPCDALYLLIESAIGGKFDQNGLAFGGESETSMTLYTKLTEKGGATNNLYIGYEDSGVVATKWSITGSAKEGVSVGFDLMGAKRVKAAAASALPLERVTTQGLNYINVKNIKVAGQTLKFTNLDFETGVPHDLRVVFGEKEGTSMAATANRDTKLTLKAFRKDFSVDGLVAGDPVPVQFEISGPDGGVRVSIPAAMCVSPTDELTDTGLLINLQFSGHFDDTANSGIVVEKL
jgi:hypothetical protein